jgi:hypothetical protein
MMLLSLGRYCPTTCGGSGLGCELVRGLANRML